MPKYIYNDTNNDEIYESQIIVGKSYYQIQDIELLRYMGCQKLLDAIDSGDVIISSDNNVSGHITDPTAAKTYLRSWS